jgi:hypothetical protein
VCTLDKPGLILIWKNSRDTVEQTIFIGNIALKNFLGTCMV